MATRSTIAVEHADGTVSQIYSHWDGYVDHNGRILYESYNTLARAEALVALGDLSLLDHSIEQPEGHSFDSPVNGCTIFYGRDRGEEDVEPTHFPNWKLFQLNMQQEEYDYVFKGGVWLVSDHGRKWEELASVISELAD